MSQSIPSCSDNSSPKTPPSSPIQTRRITRSSPSSTNSVQELSEKITNCLKTAGDELNSKISLSHLMNLRTLLTATNLMTQGAGVTSMLPLGYAEAVRHAPGDLGETHRESLEQDPLDNPLGHAVHQAITSAAAALRRAITCRQAASKDWEEYEKNSSASNELEILESRLSISEERDISASEEESLTSLTEALCSLEEVLTSLTNEERIDLEGDSEGGATGGVALPDQKEISYFSFKTRQYSSRYQMFGIAPKTAEARSKSPTPDSEYEELVKALEIDFMGNPKSHFSVSSEEEDCMQSSDETTKEEKEKKEKTQ
ncbi:MAG: hypothetical protein ACRCV3_01770 [Desulfovibrionaceae bacterium]